MAGKKGNNDPLFFLLFLLVFLIYFFPGLLKEGMFVDGVTYAAISRNLSVGEGSFWSLHYITLPGFTFNGHPPLAFFLESLFFKIFGDHFFIERLYSVLMAALSAHGIMLIWKELQHERKVYSSWLPLLLWLIIQLVSWSYQNNLLENTLSVFTLYSAWFLLRSCSAGNLLFTLPAAVLMLAALFTKGPVALFPLVIPFFNWLLFRKTNIRRLSLITSLAILFLASGFSVILLTVPQAGPSIANYLHEQLFASISGRKELAPNRFYILGQLLLQLLPLIILIVAAFFVRKRKPGNTDPLSGKNVLFYLLTGLSASLPLMISPKQRGFYLVPSLPWFALATAVFLYPFISAFTDQIGKKSALRIRNLVFILIAIILLYSGFQYGTAGRDKQLLADVSQLCTSVPEGCDISAADGLASNWQLVAYLERKAMVSLEEGRAHDYLLKSKTGEITCEFLGYTYAIVNSCETENYTLFRKTP